MSTRRDSAGIQRREQAPLDERGAFSLLELLVVIAVIAVLASLLLPALLRAKRHAQGISCLARQKQWALGFQLYADENAGWLPREGYDADGEVYWNSWHQVRDSFASDVWYNSVAKIINVPPASAYASAAGRGRFYESLSFFHCPAARFPSASRSVGYQIALFSIAMNSQLIIPPDVPYVRIARVRDPARTPLTLDNLLESEAPVVSEQARDNLGQPAAYANRFAGRRHGAGGNLSFVDGHAAFFRGEHVVETKGINAGFPILPPVTIFWEAD